MNLRNLRAEYLLYGLAFALALILRMASYGALPLSDSEAGLALIANAAARGEAPVLAPYPAYLALTTAIMYVFSASEWTARFWPALAGSLLVLVPLLFRGRLGRLPALLLAFFFAFDPLLLGISRQVNSLPLALLFVLAALGWWLNGRPLLAGIAAALALLGGPQVWPGIATLLIALWLNRLVARRQPARPVPGEWMLTADAREVEQDTSRALRSAAAAGLATLFLAGTLFFALPGGLSAMTGSLAARLGGWARPSGVSIGLQLLALALYGFFPLVFGLWGAVTGFLRREPLDRLLVVWWAAATLPALIYPARTAADLAWGIVPLWALAARQVARLLAVPRYDRAPVLGLALLSAVILAFASMTMAASVNNIGLTMQEAGLRLGGAGLMLLASALLVGWGWTAAIARRGLVFGLAIVLFFYLLSSGWHAAGFSGEAGRELLGIDAPPRSSDLVLSTLSDLNRWGPRDDNGLDLVVLEVPSPSLRWLLRDYRRVSFVNALPAEAQPALVITAPRESLDLAATYRGQSLVFDQKVNWNALRGSEWLRWLVFRSVNPAQRVENRLVLWARTDIFPGGDVEAPAAASQPDNAPLPEAAP